MFNNRLRQQTHSPQFVRWGGIMLLCGFLMACSTPGDLIPFEMPAKDVHGFVVHSVEVRPFSSNHSSYGAKMAELVKNGITSEKYINVLEQGANTILTGTVTIGRINKKAHHKRYEMKDENGRKVIKYTYYYRKELSTQATYSLKSIRGEMIAANNYRQDYDQEWSGATAAEASSKADSDDQMIINTLNGLAQKIVKAVSPHQTNWSFPLAKGVKWMPWKRHPGLKLGIQYYEKRRYDQAEKYWEQVIEQAKEVHDKAAAHNNIGVLRVRQREYGEAYNRFKKADELHPGNELYIEALTKTEKAKENDEEMDETPTAEGKQNTWGIQNVPGLQVKRFKYHLTVNPTPRDSRIRILNIKPRYRHGIELQPGRYHIEVTRRGYHQQRKWVTITNDDESVDIKLKKK